MKRAGGMEGFGRVSKSLEDKREKRLLAALNCLPVLTKECLLSFLKPSPAFHLVGVMCSKGSLICLLFEG